MSPMLTPHEARTQVLALARPLETVRLPLLSAAHHILAEPMVATRAQPPADLSAMDGYALISTDCRDASEAIPVRLRVIGAALAGRPWAGTLATGEALRITTGALLPAGATAVVAQERVSLDAAGCLVVVRPIPAGDNIRRAGEEYGPGDALLAAGTMLGPAMIGLAAAAGFESLLVHRRPRVALWATGDELVTVGEAGARPECPVDANTPMLQVAIAERHAEVVQSGHAEDRVETIAAALKGALAEADVVLTTGGASVGPTDAVAEAWERVGITTVFWKVAMKPGKPVRFGHTADGRLVFALPGNPLAALTAFELFVAPVLARLGGAPEAAETIVRLPLGSALGTGVFTRFVHGDIVGHGASARFEPAARQGSGMLRTVANHPVRAQVAGGALGAWSGAPVEVALTAPGLAGQVLRPAAPMRPMLAVTGSSGSGKTRLIEQLLYELNGRGLRAAVLKHATHRPDFDRTGKDSYRHASAGAWHNAVMGPGVVFARFSDEAAFDPFRWLAVVAEDVDVVVFEGFSEVPLPSVSIAVGGADLTMEGPETEAGRPRWRLTRPPGDGPLHVPKTLVAALVDGWLGPRAT